MFNRRLAFKPFWKILSKTVNCETCVKLGKNCSIYKVNVFASSENLAKGDHRDRADLLFDSAMVVTVIGLRHVVNAFGLLRNESRISRHIVLI